MITLLGRRGRWPVSVAAMALPLATAAVAGLLPAALVVTAVLIACLTQAWNLRPSQPAA